MSQRGEQGVPGEQGIRGNQGIQGVPGKEIHEKGEQGIQGIQGKPGKSAHVVMDKRIEVSFWAMLAIFVAVSSFMAYEFDKVSNLSEQNRQFIEADRQSLADRRELFRQLCIGQEKLKEQNRADALRDFNRLNETLALLNIELTDAIVERATRDRDHILNNNKARPDGCK